MNQFSHGLDGATAPARHLSGLRAAAAAALALSMLLVSAGPSVSAAHADATRGPGSAICRFFPIYCPGPR